MSSCWLMQRGELVNIFDDHKHIPHPYDPYNAVVCSNYRTQNYTFIPLLVFSYEVSLTVAVIFKGRFCDHDPDPCFWSRDEGSPDKFYYYHGKLSILKLKLKVHDRGGHESHDTLSLETALLQYRFVLCCVTLLPGLCSLNVFWEDEVQHFCTAAELILQETGTEFSASSTCICCDELDLDLSLSLQSVVSA